MTTPAYAAYERRKQQLRAQYAAIPAGERVRLAKRTSNLFRVREPATRPGLDVAAFDGVLSVDPVARTADVQGMTTYEHLVDATLPHGLMPLVVPQLKTITLGGAVTGLGIESSSFRNGLPHESVRELEVLTGDGRIVTATRDNAHRDLFTGFPNSYGTLGYALRLMIELEPVQPFVHLRHLPFRDATAFTEATRQACEQREYDGQRVDFVDGMVVSRDELYLTLASFTPTAPYTSDYTRQRIFYRSVQQRREDYLTVRDYLWRWDTDWFWCSRAFGAQRPVVRALAGRRFLRSDTYWKLVALERRYGMKARLDRARGLPEREYLAQDIEVTVDRTGEFLDFLDREIEISPVWVCPLRQRDSTTYDLYPLDSHALYVNVGFWSTVALAPGEPDGTHNRLVEDEVDRLDGHKSLYSAAYYDRDRFWRLYNGPAYELLKKTYDGDGRLLDLYAKCVEAR